MRQKNIFKLINKSIIIMFPFISLTGCPDFNIIGDLKNSPSPSNSVSTSPSISPSQTQSPSIIPSNKPLANNINLESGLIAYYPLNGNANDMSGNNLNAEVINAESTSDRLEKSNSAYSFNGTNAYIRIPKIPLKTFTVSYYFKSEQKPESGEQWYAGNGIVDAETCGFVNDWGTSLIDEGQIAFGVGGNGDTTIKSKKTYNDNKWHFVTAIKNDDTIKLYVDGVLEATGKGNSTLLDSPSYIALGNSPCNLESNNRWFKGSIDEIKFYNRELNNDEIKSLFDNNL